MDDRIRIEHQQEVDCFEVKRPLLGMEHRFREAGQDVFVKLPAYSGEIVKDAEAKYARASWAVDHPDDPNTTFYAVFRCTVGTRRPLSDPASDLPQLRANPPSELRRALQKPTADLLSQAFERWIKTLFWVSQERPLCSVHGNETVYGGQRIIGEPSEERLGSLGVTAVLTRRAHITMEHWTTAAAILAEDEPLPLWFNYLYEAFEQLHAAHLTRAVIAAAIASETVLRAYFWQVSGEPTNVTARRIIDNVAVQQLLTRWPELTGATKADLEKEGKKEVHKLFDYRNDAMHRGISLEHAGAEVTQLLIRTQAFVIDADRRLCDIARKGCRVTR